MIANRSHDLCKRADMVSLRCRLLLLSAFNIEPAVVAGILFKTLTNVNADKFKAPSNLEARNWPISWQER